ncbi:MAG: hypothetical protein V7604_275 [Hyphomicrobiales bacterium]|jgi:hypothetical protein
MPGIDREHRDRCRTSAVQCAQLARATADPERRQVLLIRAQEWLKLAYSDHSVEFDGLLSAFNDGQLGLTGQALARRGRMQQQQPVQQQQQQSKQKRPGER